MQAEPNQNAANVDATPTHAIDTSPNSDFIIPRSQRRQFFLTFTFMTLVGWVVGGIVSIAVEKGITEQLMPKLTPGVQEIWYDWGTYASLSIFALIFAGDQAIVMRRYISGWWWLFATSFGWLVSTKVSDTWISYIWTFAESLNRELSLQETIILGVASTSAYIFSGIWIGFCQWLILRRYTKKSWWWTFLNSCAFLLISFLLWLLSLTQTSIPEVYRDQVSYLSEQGTTALILGIIPAIALCRLHSRGKR
ncbi:hypothetical protein [Calothrix sp. UHCC 0171]|uniref:hypothetical protein n=1 Tax=Calothrix sp. UHCC 0171 TaxID=3110245 RepID=UPI002B218345|nr:hypothetical protein [Calothrix sp. UHCC 0171]MEA5572791.1 hypothetical protein [Calothrix sp. UHCC 0171]